MSSLATYAGASLRVCYVAMPAAETVGDRIRRIRKARGITQAQLAEAAAMERTDVNRAERGNLQLGPARLARVAAALGVSVLELRPEVEPDAPGLMLLERQAGLEAEVLRLAEDTRGLAVRVRALERRLPPGSQEAGSPGK